MESYLIGFDMLNTSLSKDQIMSMLNIDEIKSFHSSDEEIIRFYRHSLYAQEKKIKKVRQNIKKNISSKKFLKEVDQLLDGRWGITKSTIGTINNLYNIANLKTNTHFYDRHLKKYFLNYEMDKFFNRLEKLLKEKKHTVIIGNPITNLEMF